MSDRVLYIAWGAMYAICAGFGFIIPGNGFIYGLLVFFCLLFFLPPAILLYRGVKSGNLSRLRLIRNISLIWLVLTLVMLILNILTVAMSALAGKVLYAMLVILCAPLACGQWWALSLFLFACLLTVSIQQIRKLKK